MLGPRYRVKQFLSDLYTKFLDQSSVSHTQRRLEALCTEHALTPIHDGDLERAQFPQIKTEIKRELNAVEGNACVSAGAQRSVSICNSGARASIPDAAAQEGRLRPRSELHPDDTGSLGSQDRPPTSHPKAEQEPRSFYELLSGREGHSQTSHLLITVSL